MRDKIYYDDFTGFTFNGKHCSQFGLIRISDGDRYEDSLVLGLTNEAAEVPGGAGQYYFGEQIKERTFNIKIAYDSVTEAEKREIRQWLHPDDKLHELIFDEKPYVKYFVKCSKEVVAKELCFNEESNEFGFPTNKRIYKGEINLEFTAFMPYGIGRMNYFDGSIFDSKDVSILSAEYQNIFEWVYASRILSDSAIYSNITGQNLNQIENINATIPWGGWVYNPGDAETGFTLTLKKEASGKTYKYDYFVNYPDDCILPVNESSINIEDTNEQFFTFLPDLGKISGTNEDCVVYKGIEGNDYILDDGYIDLTGSFPMFVSNSSGNKYEICKFIIGTRNESIVGIDRHFKQGITELIEYRKYYCTDGIEQYSFYRVGTRIVCLDRGRKGDAIAFDFTMCPDYDSYLTIGIAIPNRIGNLQYLDGYTCTLKIPNAATTSPEFFTEAQKMLTSKCEIRLDSNKQTIEYREYINSGGGDTYGEWKGIAGIIAEGSLFKIPVDNSYGGPTVHPTEERILWIEPRDMGWNFEQFGHSLTYPILYI